MPIGYYTLSRLVVCAAALYFANNFYKKKDNTNLWIFGFIAVFTSEKLAKEFIDTNVIKEYTKTAMCYSHVLMHTIKSHGKWSKQNPFEASVAFDKTKPLAVITRATIKPLLAYHMVNAEDKHTN